MSNSFNPFRFTILNYFAIICPRRARVFHSYILIRRIAPCLTDISLSHYSKVQWRPHTYLSYYSKVQWRPNTRRTTVRYSGGHIPMVVKKWSPSTQLPSPCRYRRSSSRASVSSPDSVVPDRVDISLSYSARAWKLKSCC